MADCYISKSDSNTPKNNICKTVCFEASFESACYLIYESFDFDTVKVEFEIYCVMVARLFIIFS